MTVRLSKLELLLITQDPERPRSVEIRGLIERALLTKDEWDDTVLGPLVEAYVAAIQAANPSHDLSLITEAEAERAFLNASLEGYRVIFPDTAEDSEAMPWWPDALPFKGLYTKALLHYLGVVMGYDAARRTEAWYAYCRKEEAAEAKP